MMLSLVHSYSIGFWWRPKIAEKMLKIHQSWLIVLDFETPPPSPPLKLLHKTLNLWCSSDPDISFLVSQELWVTNETFDSYNYHVSSIGYCATRTKATYVGQTVYDRVCWLVWICASWARKSIEAPSIIMLKANPADQKPCLPTWKNVCRERRLYVGPKPGWRGWMSGKMRTAYY